MQYYYLSRQAALKWLETPSVYHIAKDELYELDQESFRFLGSCAGSDGCAKSDGPFVDYCLEEGILTRDAVSITRPPLRQAPAPSLRYLELQITSRCNLRCKHCYIGDRPDAESTPAAIRTALVQFEEMQGLRVLITGGEPLLHSRFDEINEMLPDFAIRRILFTNGLLLTRETLQRLKVHELQVSIDGMEAAHDRLRGAGTWQKSLDGIRRALDAGFGVSVSTMVTLMNRGDFDAMEEFFQSLGIREWTVDVPCETGRMSDYRQFAVSPAEGGKYLSYGYGGGMHATEAGFGCGLHLMALLPDGKAAKCAFYNDRPVGSIEEGLAACWNRIRPVKLDNLDCACEFLNVCRGGCRYRAEITDKPSGRDPYRCSLYGIIDKPDERC